MFDPNSIAICLAMAEVAVLYYWLTDSSRVAVADVVEPL